MKEGVVVAEKDFDLDQHQSILVINIHIIKVLQILCNGLFFTGKS